MLHETGGKSKHASECCSRPPCVQAGAYPGFREGGFHLHAHGIYNVYRRDWFLAHALISPKQENEGLLSRMRMKQVTIKVTHVFALSRP